MEEAQTLHQQNRILYSLVQQILDKRTELVADVYRLTHDISAVHKKIYAKSAVESSVLLRSKIDELIRELEGMI